MFEIALWLYQLLLLIWIKSGCPQVGRSMWYLLGLAGGALSLQLWCGLSSSKPLFSELCCVIPSLAQCSPTKSPVLWFHTLDTASGTGSAAEQAIGRLNMCRLCILVCQELQMWLICLACFHFGHYFWPILSLWAESSAHIMSNF